MLVSRRGHAARFHIASKLLCFSVHSRCIAHEFHRRLAKRSTGCPHSPRRDRAPASILSMPARRAGRERCLRHGPGGQAPRRLPTAGANRRETRGSTLPLQPGNRRNGPARQIGWILRSVSVQLLAAAPVFSVDVRAVNQAVRRPRIAVTSQRVRNPTTRCPRPATPGTTDRMSNAVHRPPEPPNRAIFLKPPFASGRRKRGHP